MKALDQPISLVYIMGTIPIYFYEVINHQYSYIEVSYFSS